jgi:transposase-like protein
MLSVVNNDEAGAEGRFGLDEICREGARTMLAAALEAEVEAYLAELVDERDENGHRLVTRNGHARQRKVQTVAGAVEITAPRVNDRRVDQATGEKAQFRSVIIPPWCRRSPKITEVLPLLYLHGLSTGDFAPALKGFFGSSAGLSASVITRLTTAWQDEHRAFMARNLADRDYVYVWVDGVHFNVRLEEERLCCLVIVGVRQNPSAPSPTPRTVSIPETPPRLSTTSFMRSGRRPPTSSATTSGHCCVSSTSRPSTGCT